MKRIKKTIRNRFFIQNNCKFTKATASQLELNGESLKWMPWAMISKTRVNAKSRAIEVLHLIG